MTLALKIVGDFFLKLESLVNPQDFQSSKAAGMADSALDTQCR